MSQASKLPGETFGLSKENLVIGDNALDQGDPGSNAHLTLRLPTCDFKKHN